MKKLILSVILVLLITMPVFACWGEGDTYSRIDIKNNPVNIANPVNVNKPVNIVAPDINNRQIIAPDQRVEIKSPTPLLSPPSQSIPEINFGHGKMDWYFAKQLPRIPIPLYDPKEIIIRVLKTKANIKAKNYLSTVLRMTGEHLPPDPNDRLIVIKAEAQKSWSTGGNVGGAGSYLPTSGLAGASGAGSIIPSWGGTKADDLYTIIIVRIAW